MARTNYVSCGASKAWRKIKFENDGSLVNFNSCWCGDEKKVSILRFAETTRVKLNE